MANTNEIEKFIEEVSEIFGERFRVSPAAMNQWEIAFKYCPAWALSKALTKHMQESQKIPTLADIRILALQMCGGYFGSKPEPKFRANKDGVEQTYLKWSMVPIYLKQQGTNNSLVRWVRKEYAVNIMGKWQAQIEAVLDVFGEAEWMDVLRNELGLKKEDGYNGIHKFMKSKGEVKRYRELVSNYANIAKERIESEAGYATNA